MEFPVTYKPLTLNTFSDREYAITPIRYEDRFAIMKWRNEQMYHLRQRELLTPANQETYYSTVVKELFNQSFPSQLLFSYMKGEECIGYGGLVHINWEDRTGEVSFIMNTQLEEKEFRLHWSTYLKLLKKVAFDQLTFKSIFTYAYNLRPHLYPVLESNGFKLKERLKEEIHIEGKGIDVLIHECGNPMDLLSTRRSEAEDMELIYQWSNDELVRSQSFNSNPISMEGHKHWYSQKLANPNSLLLMNEFEGTPAGLVRFELEGEHSVIGILVGKEHRGKGLSFRMLKKSTEYYFSQFSQPVLAYIKETNKASIRAFEKAGFTFYKETTVNEFPTFVYKIEKNG